MTSREHGTERRRDQSSERLKKYVLFTSPEGAEEHYQVGAMTLT